MIASSHRACRGPHGRDGRRAQHRRRGPGRRGVALATVLWMLTGVAALVLAVTTVARDAVTVAERRMAFLRAGWSAEACAERALAAADEALAAEMRSRGAAPGWRSLDVGVARAPQLASVADCVVTLRPAGAALDVNVTDADQLARVLTAAGVATPHADSLRDALLDWVDADEEPRPAGVERAWYVAAGRPTPRDGPLVDRRELARVRGFDALPPATARILDEALNVEPGRLLLTHAPAAALAALPGFTPEVVALVLTLRLEGVLGDARISASPSAALDLLVGDARLAPAVRDTLAAYRPAFVARAGLEPDAWILTARGGSGLAGTNAIAGRADMLAVRPEATLELRLVRAGERAAVVRRRFLP